MTFCSRCYAAKVEGTEATVHFQSRKISHEWHHYGDDHLPATATVMSTLGGLREAAKKKAGKLLIWVPLNYQAGTSNKSRLCCTASLSLLEPFKSYSLGVNMLACMDRDTDMGSFPTSISPTTYKRNPTFPVNLETKYVSNIVLGPVGTWTSDFNLGPKILS